MREQTFTLQQNEIVESDELQARKWNSMRQKDEIVKNWSNQSKTIKNGLNFRTATVILESIPNGFCTLQLNIRKDTFL